MSAARDLWHRQIGYAYKNSISAAASSLTDAQAYNYKPLDHARKEIRLLKCLHTSHLRLSTHQLRFEVRSLPFSEAVGLPYYAISYSWGENLDQEGIVLDGRKTIVPASAQQALRGALHGMGQDIDCRGQYVWIDAICINQQDLPEKSRQVAMMGEIYGNAERTFAWLGFGDDTNEALINSLEALTTECKSWTRTSEGPSLAEVESFTQINIFNLAFHRIPWPEAFDRDAFFTFLSSRWFSRLWVCQEVAMSKDVILGRGRDTIEWDYFQKVVRWLHPDIAGCSLIYAAFFDSSNPWDNVYAVLGLAGKTTTESDKLLDSTKIIPDYTKELSIVYREATWTALASAPSLMLLELLPLVTDDCSNTIEEWPSWVPKYMISNVKSLWPGPSGVTVTADHDTMKYQSLQLGARDANVLSLRGVQIGTVISVVAMPPSAETDRVGHYAALWDKEIEWSESYVRSLGLCMVGGEYELNVVGNLGRVSDPENSADLMRDFGAFMLEMKGSKRTNGELERILMELNAHEGESHTYDGNVVTSKDALVYLDNDTFGVAMHVAVGDRICIVFGCARPLVLRWADGHWRLRGRAYVPGTTTGEFIQQLMDESRLEAETIVFDVA